MKLKNILSVGLIGLLSIGAVGCSSSKGDDKTIKVGASSSPHAEILEVAKPILEKEGYKLDIIVMDDYITPNTSLSDGSLDANFFQHIPYLEQTNKEQNLGLTYTKKIHLEPIGLYSDKIKSVDEIKEGSTIAIPNDVTNEARALKLLADNKIIGVKDKEDITIDDITFNPKNIKIKEMNADMITGVLTDVEAAVINTNYALSAGLNPKKDSIALESTDSPYANVLACRKDNKDSEKIKALSKALTSDEVRKFIEEKYKGSILPAF